MFRKTLAILLAVFVSLSISSVPALAAKVVAKVDISSQRMYVYVNGKKKYSWRVSTGKSGYRTPTGYFKPTRMHRYYTSKKYRSRMDNAIFFYGGYAIHQTYATGRLGRPASHGCVRLAPGNARTLFNLVRRYGKRNTTIRITY